MPDTFSITNKTRGRMPRIPFKKMKDSVLGKRYELSVALIQPREALRITLETKGKRKASNVLSFPFSKHSGEMLLCPATARAQAASHGLSAHDFLVRLFIHGMLHLKGTRHGSTMDIEERRIARRFGFTL